MAIFLRRPSLPAPPFTWATKPATYPTGQPVWISDAGAKGSMWVYHNTRWRPLNGIATLSALTTISSNVANSETIVFQYQLPAGLLQTFDRLRLVATMLKSGATDVGTVKARIGTAGTTSDTQVLSSNVLAAAGRSSGFIIDFRLESATTIQQLPNGGQNSIAMSYGSSSNSAQAAAVTITSAAANALFFSVSILSSSTNDTVNLQDAILQLMSDAA